jgi:hypothetical protein
MADKTYKVGESIDVVYQAAGGATGVVVTMSVYDEAGALDAGQSGAMVEIGATGRYKKSFTPDAEGLWLVQTNDANGGKTVKSFSVGQFNVAEIGATVTTINAKVDDLQTAVENLVAPSMIG